MKRYYIEHDARFGRCPEDGVALFGPFRLREAIRHINDEWADMLEYWGELRIIKFTGQRGNKTYINPGWSWKYGFQGLQVTKEKDQ